MNKVTELEVNSRNYGLWTQTEFDALACLEKQLEPILALGEKFVPKAYENSVFKRELSKE